MVNLKSFESRPTALICIGKDPVLPTEWRIVDIDAAFEHIKLLQPDAELSDLFAINVPGLDKFFPDKKSKLVGVFGNLLLDSKNTADVSENYFKCGYDILVLSETGKLVQHRQNNKCKVFLRTDNGCQRRNDQV